MRRRRNYEADLENQLSAVTNPRIGRFRRVGAIRDMAEMLVMVGYAAPDIARDIYGLLLNYHVPNEALALVTEGMLMGGTIIYSTRRAAHRIMASLEKVHKKTKRQQQSQLDFGVRKKRNVPDQLAISDRPWEEVEMATAPPNLPPPSALSHNSNQWINQQLVGHAPRIHFNLDKYGKGGYRGDRYTHLEVINHVQRVVEETGFVNTTIGSRRFQAVPKLAGANLENSPNLTYSSIDGTAFSFNGVWELLSSRDLIFSSNFDYPDYETASYSSAQTKPIIAEKDSNALACLMNQQMHITFKNASLNDTTAAGDPSTTPIDFIIYLVQAKQDIYQEVSTISQIHQDLNQSFQQAFNFKVGTDDKLSTLRDQPPWVNMTTIKQPFADLGYKVLKAQRRHLAPGQEVVVTANLKKPQVLSFQFTKKSKLSGYRPGVSTPQYDPIVHKKGEMFFIVNILGGLASYNGGSRFEHEPAKLGYKCTFKYDIKGLYRDPQIEILHRVAEFVPASGTIDGDEIDPDHV